MRFLAALLLLALVGPAIAAVPVTAQRYHVTVSGETADGYLAYPTSATPTTLLVFGHGCCGKPDQSAFVRRTRRRTASPPSRWTTAALADGTS